MSCPKCLKIVSGVKFFFQKIAFRISCGFQGFEMSRCCVATRQSGVELAQRYLTLPTLYNRYVAFEPNQLAQQSQSARGKNANGV